jgi:hypothetical protein
VLPGSVGGDVMKAYYLCQRTPESRSQVLTTLFIDRILGLLALLILPMIAVAWNLDLLTRVPAMKALFYAVSAVVAIAVVGFATVAAAGPGIAARLAHVSAMPRLTGLVSKLLEAMVSYREKPGVLLQAIVLGLVNHMIAVYAFMLAARTIAPVPVGYQEMLFVVPLGLATTAVPISPAGIGVGQAAFFSLFSGMPGVSGRLGSEACTVYQFVMILVYLTGIGVYIFYRGEVQSDAKRTAVV